MIVILFIYLNLAFAGCTEIVKHFNSFNQYRIIHEAENVRISFSGGECPNYRDLKEINGRIPCYIFNNYVHVVMRTASDVTFTNLLEGSTYKVTTNYFHYRHKCETIIDILATCPDSGKVKIYNGLYENDHDCTSTYDRLCAQIFYKPKTYPSTLHEPIEIRIKCYDDDDDVNKFEYITSMSPDASCEEISCLSNGEVVNELTHKCDANTESQDYYIIYIDLSESFKLYCPSILRFVNFMEPTSEPAPIISPAEDNWYTITTTVSSRYVCNKGLRFNHEYWVLRASIIPGTRSNKHYHLYLCKENNGKCKTNLFESKYFNKNP